MASPRKAASRTSSTESGQSGDVQQAGRRASSFYAERAAAVEHLNQASRNQGQLASTPALWQNSSLPNSRNGPVDTRRSSSEADLQPPHSPHGAQRHPKLTPETASNSSHGEPVIDGPATTSYESRRPAFGSQTSLGAISPEGRPSPYLPMHRTRRSVPEIPQRMSSPLSVSDLGSDYTRYFSPFNESPRNSATGGNPPTPRPRYHSSNSRGSASVLGANPFSTPNVSTTKINESDLEKNGFLVDDRLAAPYEEKGGWDWPRIDDADEDDDDMHMPQPDDDVRYKAHWKDHFSKANVASTFGLAFMIFGLLFVFVGLPVMSRYGALQLHSHDDPNLNAYPDPEPWAIVNNRTYALLQNLRTGLIDRDTPESAKTKLGEFGDEYVLVFSDEFNVNNRTFYEGDDPYWTAPDIWYGATQDLEWYDPDAVTTWDGTLEMRLDKFINHGLNFRSGMLNSWNQLCFKGGIFEVSMSLPGPGGVQGLWPGAWTMGNLGRPGYLSTTDGMWPYTYNSCDVGITPNQSSYDGLSRLPGQRLPSCTCPNEDHPTPGTGRGAPEIDIVEAGATPLLPIATQSYQVAPFDIWYYPDYNFTAFPDYSVSYTNGYTGGPYQQAVSATTNLNKDWYDGKAYQKYSFEYVPGEGEGSYISWKVGGQTTFLMDGRAIGPNGNIQSRLVSEEPMSLVLNLGISGSWTFIDWPALVFPTVMRVDYVRWYQKPGEEMVTCDPPGYETTEYIKDHLNAYTNPNFTRWDQTGHQWPKHQLNTQC